MYPDLWDLPGGFKENNETYEDCVIREFKEETNLDIKIKCLKNIKSQIYNNEIIIVLIYTVECNQLDKILLDNSHVDYKFVKNINKNDVIWYLKDNVYNK